MLICVDSVAGGEKERGVLWGEGDGAQCGGQGDVHRRAAAAAGPAEALRRRQACRVRRPAPRPVPRHPTGPARRGHQGDGM